MTTPPLPTTVYTGRATNWPVVLVSVAALTLLVVGARPFDQVEGRADAEVVVVITAAVVGALFSVLTATSIRTAVGPNGVAIRFGVFGWPRLGYRIADISRAEVIDLPWWAVAFGLWWTPRRTCCTVRSGPTLRLTLTSGRTVTVTVPDPHTAAATLEAAR